MASLAEFAELALIGEDGEEQCHEEGDFPMNKVELREAIEQDDNG
jgi:hypothetical protein